jgi:TDG/mug DNA glycosylase family protein
VLILGTLPGGESLKRGEYYANTSNSFWRIMDCLFGARLDLPYRDRLKVLTHNGIAILLSTVAPNDFATFLQSHPKVQMICFNGRAAERIFLRNVSADAATIRYELLPSTSPANTRMTYEQKLSQWHDCLSSATEPANPDRKQLEVHLPGKEIT